MIRKIFHLPRFWGEKLILIIIFFLFALFFTNDFGLIDIQKTAIILAVGIDKTQTGNFNVTAQIAVPQASKSGGETSAISVAGEGETVAQAFKEINAKTGWFTKLIFCDLIILGEDVVQEDVFNCFGYFLRNEYMSDNCLLATCEGKAEEILNAVVPTENMTALALQKILATEAKQAGNISTVNLKDFSVGYYAEHKSGYMPYIRMVNQKEGNDEAAEQNEESTFLPTPPLSVPTQGGTSKQEKSKTNDEEKIFKASETAVFFSGKKVGVLTEAQSFAMNLVVNSIRQATLEVPIADKVYALALTGISSKIQFDVNDNSPRLTVNLKAVARISDCSSSLPLQDVAQPNQVRKEILSAAEQILKQSLLEVFETCRAVKCDIFEVLDKLKKFKPDYYNAYKEVILTRIISSFSVHISAAA